ncbi:MAG: hypothetical protein ACK4WK_08645, partial [Anaerolineae bacterium]
RGETFPLDLPGEVCLPALDEGLPPEVVEEVLAAKAAEEQVPPEGCLPEPKMLYLSTGADHPF